MEASGGHVSTDGGRSRTINEQGATRLPAKRHLRIVKDELSDAEQRFVGGAMSLAREECSDDRRSPPEGPGVWLRRNREAHALTLEDLARTTKISKTVLTAIEDSDLQRLPAGIYTRGFVKAYAREVGLDPDATAEEYLTGLEPLRAHPPLDDSSAHLPKTDPGAVIGHGHDHSQDALPADQSRHFGWLAVAVVALIVYLVAFGGRDDPGPAASVTALDATGSDAVAASQVTGESGALRSNAALAVGQPFRLELRTQGLCWLVLTIDGEPVLARLLTPGERHAFDVEEEAVLRVGDPGALTLSINGETGRPLGLAGDPVDVRITATNFHQFLGN
jgi:cytoskeletal protein RodZ